MIDQPSDSGVTAAAFYGALNFWQAAFPGSLLGSFAPGSPYDPNAPLARLSPVASVVLTAPDFPLHINSRPEILKLAGDTKI